MRAERWPPRALTDHDDAQTRVIKQCWYLIACIIALGAGDQIFPALHQVWERAMTARGMREGRGMAMMVGQWTNARGTNEGGCADVIDTGAAVMLRDDNGNQLTYTYDEWVAFLAGVLDDRFTPACAVEVSTAQDGVPQAAFRSSGSRRDVVDRSATSAR